MKPVEMGRDLRTRRRARGMTQARLAGMVGVRPLVLGRWERGERVPTRAQVHRLAEILDVDPAVAAAWTETAGRADRTEPSTAVRIVQALGGSDPWGDLPSPVVATRQESKRWWRLPPGPAGTRPVPAGGAAAPRSAVVAMPAPHPRLATAPDGDVFPAPAARTPRVPYMEDPEQQRVYTVRSALTLAMLGALAIALVWAWGQLGDGWGAFLDLFRGDTPASDLTDALGLVFRRGI